MARAVWLAAVLRKAGCRVVEMDGWQTRETRVGFNPQGVVWHHTATGPNVSNLNVRKLLRDGRSDLSGPLCQLGLERDGTYVVIAAGRANHAGFGTPWGNDSIGIEAYNDGVGEPWPKVQLDAFEDGTAAILTALHLGAPQVKAHREVDPGRKIDPTGIDMNQARARIADLLTPKPQPLAPSEDPMLYIREEDPKSRILLTNGVYVVVDGEAEYNASTPTLRCGNKLWTWLAKRPGLVRL
jgi:hypothetical protein